MAPGRKIKKSASPPWSQFGRRSLVWQCFAAKRPGNPRIFLCVLLIFAAIEYAYAAGQPVKTAALPAQFTLARGSGFQLVATTRMASSRPKSNSNKSLDLSFAPNSFWYNRIPIDAPLHPNSAAFVDDFLRQFNRFYGNVTINTNSYSSPVYFVGSDVAPVSVAQWDCQKRGFHDQQLDQQWRAVPIPPYARPADGTDSEMTIYQPATDTMWEFWRARRVNGRWEACWGGRMLNVSESDGIWPPHYGATATGLPFVGGQITVDELSRGAINHVIGIALVETESANIYSWPANRSDGYNPSDLPNRIPEGLRFRLDATIDVNAQKIHPVAKIIARAAQTYGFVVWDKAGALSLRAENPKRFTAVGLPDPYPAIWNGTPPYEILTGFPWEKLQFLPMNYGRP